MGLSMRRPGTRTRVRLSAYRDGEARERVDALATEEPLEIRILSDGIVSTAAVTMRTPGADFELAAGFLHGEGIVADRNDVDAISYCVDPDVDVEQRYNIVNVALSTGGADIDRLERHFTMTSACGVCGKASLDALELRGVPPVSSDVTVDAAALPGLPETLRAAQTVFERTGGLHAAGLFTPKGELVAVREDVGRHNALDKLIGWAMLEGRLPLRDAIVLVSGRASFELLQKSVAAGVPVVCAVSAPSSLAVDVAERFGVTLVGFLRGHRFNVYANGHRVRL